MCKVKINEGESKEQLLRRFQQYSSYIRLEVRSRSYFMSREERKKAKRPKKKKF